MRTDKKTTKKSILIICMLLVLAAAGFTIGMIAKSSMASGSNISIEEAKSIALANVGVSAEKAIFTKATQEGDVYEIDFYTTSNVYDFEIAVANGAILEKEASVKEPDAAQAPSEETSASQKNGDSSVIGVDSAKAIALKYAGVSSASFQEAKLDSDDGIRIYDIEFSANGINYDFEINAYTGAILAYDTSKAVSYTNGSYDDDDDDDDDD